MKIKFFLSFIAIFIISVFNGQNVMTPEKLWSLNRLSVQAVAPDNSALIYSLAKTDLQTEKSSSEKFLLNLENNRAEKLDLGKKSVIQWDANGIYAKENGVLFLSKDAGKSWTVFYKIGDDAGNIVISPDAKKVAFSREVLLEKILAKDKYSDVPNSTAHIYTDLNHRHWDAFSEGKFNHIFVVETSQSVENATDILAGKKWDTPQRPFGGSEDFIFSPDSSQLIFVLKPLSGIEYAKSTNTDIFAYDLKTKALRNLSAFNKGYDVKPKFSPDGKYLSWLSMPRDGFESDKNNLMLMDWKSGKYRNLTQNWNESITGDFAWNADSKGLFFTAAFRGSKQLFGVEINQPKVRKIAGGNFDINSIHAQTKNALIIGRTDFNHNNELFSADVKSGKMLQISDVNRENYSQISPSKSEMKMVKTSDGKEMGVWFIYPPNFDPNKKYPALLYCQGGPQSALTQYFSMRWNFALMAAQGYVVIAPNRRGMPGWGTEWNEAISKDWGGQPMRDYLAATDFAKTLPFIDGERIGAVGASYGGYSVLMLAGIHEGRFKTFISHNGLFDMKMWSLTTEELWFADWDAGTIFDKPLPKSFTDYNPSNFVEKWNRPMMIIQGQKDYRVPYEQGQAAFQAAKLRGLKAKFLYYPDENHWVLKPHNAIVWQREFFDWLKETL
ncbi:Dipeptidyl aminopeptidase/acylaminoacyl peptidase [Cruoricaptor ignavus]|uniref:Dipeptidyl aminopeptidase/acylaminoacyl peptidase n=1 Tax=Cruoricaptor ignavus TaxID=1118202 RepID=A0A1M6EAB5_9FLAO|nr:S9 family peptidase [Cruoricaptor ignavus]SHI82395.1 Dipeptidyl aminopeptidase/acylaminoacyl peptidase [Cruoricaptor ignavus]